MANTLKYTDGTGPAFVDGTTGKAATFDVQAQTADRVYAVPDASGTLLIDTDLSAYAPLASPTFTGTPAAPTADPEDASTQVATTAFVRTAIVAPVSVLSVSGGDTTTLSQSQVPQANAIITSGGTLPTYTLGLEDGLYGGTIFWVLFKVAVTALTWTTTNIDETEGLALPAAIVAGDALGFVYDDGNGGGVVGWKRFQ